MASALTNPTLFRSPTLPPGTITEITDEPTPPALPPSTSAAAPADLEADALPPARNRTPSLLLFGIGAAVGGAAVATHLFLPAHPAKLLVGAGLGARVVTDAAHQQRRGAQLTSSVSWAQTATMGAAFALSGAAVAAAARLMLRIQPAQALGSALIGVAIGVAPVLLAHPASPVSHSRAVTTLRHYADHAAAWEGVLRLPLALVTFCSIAVFPASGALALSAAALGTAHTGAKVMAWVGGQSDSDNAPELGALHLQLPLAGAALLGMLIGTRL